MTSKELISCNLLIICWFQLSCQRFKIYFIIKDLNSVYGIEQLIGYWNIQCVLGFLANDWPLPIGKRENSNTSWIFFHQKRQRTSKQNVLHYLLHWQMVIVEKQAAVWKQLLILLYHIFSGKYSSFEFLIRCQMPTLYHTPTLLHTPTLYRTPTLYTLLFKYMIKCIKHGKKFKKFQIPPKIQTFHKFSKLKKIFKNSKNLKFFKNIQNFHKIHVLSKAWLKYIVSNIVSLMNH